MAKTPPTELQLEVLQWIADGCPEGVLTDPKFKVSAYALERRDLVRVKRKRNPWIAEITDAGKQLLANGGSASVAAAAPANGTLSIAAGASTRAPSTSTSTSRPQKEPVKAPAAPPKSATQKMVDLLMVEGSIEFTRAETGRYRQLATVARRKNLLPEDMELVVTTHWNEPCTIVLKRRPEWQLVALPAIDVPAIVRTPHHVVAKLTEQRKDRLGMDAPRWSWTLRIVQGLAEEAERRGYAVTAVPEPRPDHWGRVSREEQNKGHIKVSLSEDEVHLRFSQATELTPRVLSASELRRQANGYSVPTEERVKTEFLSIRLAGLEPHFWQSEWTETKASRADSLLPRIVQEIELRAARAVERRAEMQRREDEKQRRWEAVRQRAIQRLNEDHRAAVLLDQADRFQRVKLLTEYIGAVRNHIESLDAKDAAAANNWLQWAESHARSIDPLLGELRMPEDPKPDADAIKPYMNGWSPYRPERTLWG